MTEYRWKQKGPEVTTLQEALIAKGYTLPKYGADGDLGGETWGKVEAYGGVDQYPTSQTLPVSVTDSILGLEGEPGDFDYPQGYVRVQGDPNDSHGTRSWSQITTIMLHQTGVWMTDTPDRFDTVNAHVGILKDHETPIVQIHDLRAYCYHGNEANSFSIGIEINGSFPGLITKYNSGSHSSDGPSASQVRDTRRALQWIMDEVAANGGEIKHIIPHRVSNDTKASDPGEVTWRAIGLWAQTNLGLTDMGPGYCVGDGTPICKEWDPRPAYKRYSYT